MELSTQVDEEDHHMRLIILTTILSL